MSAAFSTQPGGFYVSDDDATLVHQYWTKTPKAPIISSDGQLSLTPGYPIAVAEGEEIDTGSVLTIRNAFLRIDHLAINPNEGTELFLNRLQFTLGDKVNTCPDTKSITKKFEIDVHDKKGNKLNTNRWILYTQAQSDDPTPSLSTQLNTNPTMSNTGYDATNTRTTLYLMDSDNQTCYQAQLNENGLKSFEFGIHTGEKA